MMITAMVLVLCGGATAQTTLDLGLKAGGGMSKLNVEGFDWKTGFDGGAFLSINFGQNFSIQPEVLYTQKGMKLSFMGLVDVTWKLDYVEVPVLIKRTFPTSGSVKPVLFAGPAIGFLTTAKLTASALGIEEEFDIKDVHKSTDFGLCVGGGIDWLMGTSGKLTMDVRFTASLTDNFDRTNDVVEAYIPAGEGLHNWNIAFMVGYGFNLGKSAGVNP
jgi:hypothetical protein